MKHWTHSVCLSSICDLQPYQPGKPIGELARELGLTNIIKLASNESPIGPSPKAIQAIEGALPELARYPDGNGFNLKKALADKHQLSEDQIVLGNGSNEILELVGRVFLQPGSHAVFSEYAFAIYGLVTQSLGAECRIVAAYPQTHATAPFGHDLQALKAAIGDQTRVVFIANPNNPTGTWLEAKALEEFLDSVPSNTVIVLDCAYAEYMSEEGYYTGESWLKKYSNLLITKTFSKAYGLAGIRVGYGLGSPEMIDLLNRVRQPFNINSLALVAAETALSDVNHLSKAIAVNDAGLLQIYQGLNKLNLYYIDSVANFVAFKIDKNGLNAMQVYEKLLAKGVIVRPLANYRMADFLRVSVGTTEENDGFLQALTEVLDAR